MQSNACRVAMYTTVGKHEHVRMCHTRRLQTPVATVVFREGMVVQDRGAKTMKGVAGVG